MEKMQIDPSNKIVYDELDIDDILNDNQGKLDCLVRYHGYSPEIDEILRTLKGSNIMYKWDDLVNTPKDNIVQLIWCLTDNGMFDFYSAGEVFYELSTVKVMRFIVEFYERIKTEKINTPAFKKWDALKFIINLWSNKKIKWVRFNCAEIDFMLARLILVLRETGYLTDADSELYVLLAKSWIKFIDQTRILNSCANYSNDLLNLYEKIEFFGAVFENDEIIQETHQNYIDNLNKKCDMMLKTRVILWTKSFTTAVHERISASTYQELSPNVKFLLRENKIITDILG